MSLRLPNAPMEGLSIDVKKFASDASTFFNRARQYTEEQLGQGEYKNIPLNIYNHTLDPLKYYAIDSINHFSEHIQSIYVLITVFKL